MEQAKLTYEDFRQLQMNPAAEARAQIASKIVVHLEESEVGTANYQLILDIVNYLQRDPKIEVRETLSNQMKHSPRAPKAVVMLLATDEADVVAVPVLKSSPLLTDKDLVEIIQKTQKSERLEAIANRDQLGSETCQAIIDSKHMKAVLLMARNDGASLEESHLEKISSVYGYQEDIWNSLSLRRDHEKLNVIWYRHEVMQRVANDDQKGLSNSQKVSLVSSQIDVQPTENASIFELDYTYWREKLLMSAKADDTVLCEMIEKMNREGMLNATMILMALTLGHRRFVSVCFSRQTRVSIAEAALNCGIGQQKFRQMYIRSRLSTSFLPLVQFMLDACNSLIAKGVEPLSKAFELSMAEYFRAATQEHINFARTVGGPIIKSIQNNHR